MSKARDVYGLLSLGYTNVILPLEQAHKVQEILAKYAKGSDAAYRAESANVKYIMEYNAPDVAVIDLPKYDCTGMTPQQRLDWAQSVRDSEGDNFLSPQEFIALRSEQ